MAGRRIHDRPTYGSDLRRGSQTSASAAMRALRSVTASLALVAHGHAEVSAMTLAHIEYVIQCRGFRVLPENRV